MDAADKLTGSNKALLRTTQVSRTSSHYQASNAFSALGLHSHGRHAEESNLKKQRRPSRMATTIAHIDKTA
eukprot:6200553-Pleurochrysis_carterae.AAC.3